MLFRFAANMSLSEILRLDLSSPPNLMGAPALVYYLLANRRVRMLRPVSASPRRRSMTQCAVIRNVGVPGHPMLALSAGGGRGRPRPLVLAVEPDRLRVADRDPDHRVADGRISRGVIGHSSGWAVRKPR